MSKRIVIGLEKSNYTQTALKIAVRRAKQLSSVLVGVAVVDVEDIKDSVGGAPAGAIHFAEKAIEKNLTLAEQRAQELIRDFESLCKQNDISYESYIKVGNPAEEIIEEGLTADLIIVGVKTHFHLEHPEVVGDTLKELLKASVCPVMAVTKEEKLPTDTVLIAYDGSVQASNAIREYVHISADLPFAKKAVLLNVNDNIEEGMEVLKKVENYLKLYSIETSKLVKSGKPAKVIHEVAKEIGNPLVLIGAYGHSGLTELFFGSTAKEIIEDGNFPIFVYH